MKFRDLKQIATAAGLSQKALASFISRNGYVVSQPTVNRWFQRQNLSREMDSNLEGVTLLLKRKHELGLLEKEEEMAAVLGEQLKEADFPSEHLGRLSPDLVQVESPNVSKEEDRETVFRMASAGLDRGAKEKVEDGFLSYLGKWLAKIPFATDAYALYLFVVSEDDLIKVAPAVGALLYFISPVDLVPDYLPIVGFLDDASVIAAVCGYLAVEVRPYKAEAVKQIRKLTRD